MNKETKETIVAALVALGLVILYASVRNKYIKSINEGEVK